MPGPSIQIAYELRNAGQLPGTDTGAHECPGTVHPLLRVLQNEQVLGVRV